MSEDDYVFFTYEPYPEETEGQESSAREMEIKKAVSLIEEANKELPDGEDVDMIVFPEAALSLYQFNYLEEILKARARVYNVPSVIIAGVRESREELADELNTRRKGQLGRKLKNEEVLDKEDFNFPRNAVYCKYFDRESSTDGGKTKGGY